MRRCENSQSGEDELVIVQDVAFAARALVPATKDTKEQVAVHNVKNVLTL